MDNFFTNEALKHFDHTTHISEINQISVFQKSPIPGLAVDEATRIVAMNEKAEEKLGGFQEWEGSSFKELCLSDYDSEQFERFISQQCGGSIELQLKTIDAGAWPVQVEGCEEDGVRYIFLKSSIENASMERELELYKQAFAALPDGIVMFDLYGMIFFANPAFCYQTGQKMENLLGANILEMWRAGDGNSVKTTRNMESRLRQGQPFQEVFLLQKQGLLLYYETRVNPIGRASSEIFGFIAMQRLKEDSGSKDWCSTGIQMNESFQNMIQK